MPHLLLSEMRITCENVTSECGLSPRLSQLRRYFDCKCVRETKQKGLGRTEMGKVLEAAIRKKQVPQLA